MKFPVFSLLAGNLAFSETSSQLTPPSTSESIANLTGLDWTQKYLAIVEAAESLPATQAAYLDGELCGMRSDGTTSFSMIQAASDAG